MAGIPEELFRFPLKDLARICCVSERTVRRWLNGQAVTPPATIILLRALNARDLGFFHSAWAGWVLSRRGELCSPENWVCTPGNVRAMQLKEAQVSALQHEVMDLRAELEELQGRGPWLDEQPQPDDIASSQLKLTKII
jgi:hypothetical protein